MKYFSVALVVALFCAVAVSAAPSPSPFTSELSLIEESTFGLTDVVTKILNSLIEKTKCTLDVIQDIIGDTSLKNVFKKFRADIESILKNDVKECLNTKGFTEKIKCTYNVTKKINSLYFNFIGAVLKTNKDLAVKITKALIQCAKKPAPFVSNEEAVISAFDDEMTFGLTGIIESIYDALIKKTKCALDAIDAIIDEGELRNVFKKLRAEVEEILTKDVKKCAHTNGLINKTKCLLTLQQKINTLYANFVNEVFKTNKNVAKNVVKAVVQCVKPPKPEEPKTTTTTTTTTTEEPSTTTTEEPETAVETFALFDDESTFGLTNFVTKIMNALIEKTKCTLDVIQDMIDDSTLKNVFKKYRTDVETIIKVNVTECLHTKGFTGKLKCAYKVTKKVNSLYFNFIGTVLKTNKDLAVKITKALVQCVKKPAPFVSNEEVAITSFDDEMTFDLTDTISNLLSALIEKTKCALNAIQDLLEEGALKNIYKKLRADVEAILTEDVKQCAQTEGVIGKLKCTLTVTQKLNTLFANFAKEALKANKSVAGKIYKALVQCAKASN